MRILVVGAGGVGGYFGGLLAKASVPVTFLARGEHLKAIQSNGLTVRSIQGDFKVNVDAVSSVEGLSPFELVLVSVKSNDLEDACKAIISAVNEKTAVISLLNGVESEEIIGKVVGIEKVIGGVAFIGAKILSPGIIEHSAIGRITFGEMNGEITERVKRIKELFDKAGINSQISTDIKKNLWGKLLWNAAFNPVTALTQLTVDRLLDSEAGVKLLKEIMKEVIAVSKCEGVELETGMIEKAIMFSRDLKGVKTSMLQDRESGKKMELDALIGVIVRLGEKYSIPAPYSNAIFLALKTMER